MKEPVVYAARPLFQQYARAKTNPALVKAILETSDGVGVVLPFPPGEADYIYSLYYRTVSHHAKKKGLRFRARKDKMGRLIAWTEIRNTSEEE